jgi:23S rRNA (adenine2503-C2)-methyltransferase
MTVIQKKLNLKALNEEDIFLFIKDLGLPRYRGVQLIHRIYKKYDHEIDKITEFSQDLRNMLGTLSFISNLVLLKRMKSSDGTEKFLFALEDSQTIESVLIPEKGRFTLCISSQVGCGMGCRFCLTAEKGFIRNLKAYEIVDQIIAVNKLIRPQKITNIVFMGMGEPFLNFNEVVESIRRIVFFIGISRRKITVSTSGIVPKINRFAKESPEVNLAVSLNATTNESRSELMPVNNRYPLDSLLNACRNYSLRFGRRITFEYVMINEKNDSPEDAFRLVELLRGLHCKVNLIPYNQSEAGNFMRPPDDRILKFQKILMDHCIRTLIRESRGQDIFAACGQLRGEYSNQQA